MGIISDALELQMENKRLKTKIKELEQQSSAKCSDE